jgi:hypothetical protein
MVDAVYLNRALQQQIRLRRAHPFNRTVGGQRHGEQLVRLGGAVRVQRAERVRRAEGEAARLRMVAPATEVAQNLRAVGVVIQVGAAAPCEIGNLQRGNRPHAREPTQVVHLPLHRAGAAEVFLVGHEADAYLVFALDEVAVEIRMVDGFAEAPHGAHPRERQQVVQRRLVLGAVGFGGDAQHAHGGREVRIVPQHRHNLAALLPCPQNGADEALCPQVGDRLGEAERAVVARSAIQVPVQSGGVFAVRARIVIRRGVRRQHQRLGDGASHLDPRQRLAHMHGIEHGAPRAKRAMHNGGQSCVASVWV